jgi:hypothetical protein
VVKLASRLAMALSSLRLAFVGILELFRLVRCDNRGLAIEVVMLPHGAFDGVLVTSVSEAGRRRAKGPCSIRVGLPSSRRSSGVGGRIPTRSAEKRHTVVTEVTRSVVHQRPTTRDIAPKERRQRRGIR